MFFYICKPKIVTCITCNVTCNTCNENLHVNKPKAPIFDAWPPPEVLNDKRHRDFETRPRRWQDEGFDSEPGSNAPSEGGGEEDPED